MTIGQLTTGDLSEVCIDGNSISLVADPFPRRWDNGLVTWSVEILVNGVFMLRVPEFMDALLYPSIVTQSLAAYVDWWRGNDD